MLTALLLTVVYGAVWGVLWGGLDAVFIVKGFLADQSPIQQIVRSFISMIVSSILTGLVFSSLGIGGGGLIAVLIAAIVAWYARPWVLSRWRW